MFAARGIAVAFSVFVLVYSWLSFAVCCAWRWIWLRSQKLPARRCADLLFALRVFPVAAAGVVTMALAVPSFLLLEPRTIDEPLGWAPLTLGLCGLILALYGAFNAGSALVKASRTIARWVSDASLVDSSGRVPVWRISQVVPALTAVGILHPRVLLSGAAEFLLTAKELQTALRHELAHVRRGDNLKQFLLC